MGGLPDPDWYFEHVLYNAVPGMGAVDVGDAARWQAWWSAQRTDDDVVRRAASQGFVLRLTDLDALGVSRSTSRTKVSRGTWTAAGPGVVAPLALGHDSIDQSRRRHAVRSSGAALRHPHHVVSGSSSALLHGLPTPGVPHEVGLTRHGTSSQGRRAGRHIRTAFLSDTAVTDWFGVPVTTVARTLVDLGRHNRRNAIMAADAALRARLVTADGIDDGLADAVGWPGVRQARAVLALADLRAESPLESIVRLALHDDGFPPPDPQYRIAGWRVDFCRPSAKLILEADGRGKYSADALWQEKKREHELRVRGFRVERVIWSDLTRDWPRTSSRLWAALKGR